jgi:predicted nucleotide-binding protein
MAAATAPDRDPRIFPYYPFQPLGVNLRQFSKQRKQQRIRPNGCTRLADFAITRRMHTPVIGGSWSGKFVGTDHGSLTLELNSHGEQIEGVAHLHAPALGRRQAYDVKGDVGSGDSIELTLTCAPGSLPFSRIHILCSLEFDDSLTGQWKGDDGNEGVFVASRLAPFAAPGYAAPRAGAARNKPTLPAAPKVEKKTKPTPAALPVAPVLSVRKAKPILFLHGRDETVRQTVSRYFEAIGVAPLVLRDATVTDSATAAEELARLSAQAKFAVVLLTPDDVGYSVGQPGEKRSRPAQTLVLELGYITAKLGADKILVLTHGNLDIATNVLGLNTVAVDHYEGWKMRLARELRSAGFHIDLNGAL